MRQPAHEDKELAAAKAAAATLQEAAHGGTPVAIPAAYADSTSPALEPPASTNPAAFPESAPLVDIDPEESDLEGGGRR
ncbi:MAG TPA: hypothetical protein VG871_22010 [Vicinamibacterales bacterium]|nr:hypothetical protein [Vicinamibacterales bacterium]